MAVTIRTANEAYRLKLKIPFEEPTAPERLICARNDRAAFQLILNSDRQYSVNVAQEDWYTPRRATEWPHQRLRVTGESALDLRLQSVDYVRDDDVRKTDVLSEQGVRESSAGEPSAVWCEVTVPADAAPGDYAVTLRVYAAFPGCDEERVGEVTVPVRVYDVLLPDAKDSGFYLNFWQHVSNIARQHDVRLWSDEHFALLRRYVRTLAELGQKSVTVIASQIPWSGQSCYKDHRYSGNLFEYSMIRAFRSPDGTFRYDYSPMQRYIDLCAEEGVDGQIEVLGVCNVWRPGEIFPPLCPDYPDDIRVRYLDESDGCMKYMRQPEELDGYIRALEEYFVATGQIDRVRISADEPADVEKYRASLEHLHRVAPRFLCATAINHAEFIEQFRQEISTAAPHISCVRKQWDVLREAKARYPEKTVLWYTCCSFNGKTPPNQHIEDPLTDCRVVGPLTEFLGLDGFLRWAYTAWNDDPRGDLRLHLWEAGDANLVYPGRDGRPLLSLRYKNLQRGIGDYALLQMVKRRFGAEEAVERAGRLMKFSTPDQLRELYEQRRSDVLFASDWETFNNWKAELLERLQGN